MSSSPKKQSIKFILSPHSQGVAGRKFDEAFSDLNDFELRELKAGGKLFGVFVCLLAALFSPFFGVFSSITLFRVLLSRDFWCADEVCISRTLFPFFLFRSNVCFLMHNIESLYYFEEAKAEASLVKRFLYFHQGLTLLVLEKFVFKKAKVFCLSKLESRWLSIAFKNPAVFCYKLLWEGLEESHKSAISLFSSKGSRCFFGAFDNVRNIAMARDVVKAFPDAKLFGRHGERLPSDLRGNYSGVIENFSEVSGRYTLTLIQAPRSGIQTKVIDWVLAGGKVDIPKTLARRMGVL